MKDFVQKYALLIFLIVTFVGSIVWISANTVIWKILNVESIESDFWSMLEALSTAVAAIAVLGAGIFANRELAEISRSRHMDVAGRLFEELNSDSSIDSRRWIYNYLPNDANEGLKSLSEEGHKAIKDVLNSLDHVAFLTQNGWIPDEIIMPWMHPMISKTWEKLEPYVLYERKRRNEPYYYEHASELAERCNHWRVQNMYDVKNKWISDSL